jgi:hypothetical protein
LSTISEYEDFYNRRLCHSTLGYLGPMEYERRKLLEREHPSQSVA